MKFLQFRRLVFYFIFFNFSFLLIRDKVFSFMFFSMAEKILKSVSPVDFQHDIDLLGSDDDVASVHVVNPTDSSAQDKKPSKKYSSSKSRSVSCKPKKESVDKRMDSLKKRLDENFDSILQLVQSLKSQKQQDTEGMAGQIPVSVAQDDHPLGVRGPVSEGCGPSGMRRPLISLENEVDREYGIPSLDIPQDLLSLNPGQREKDSLGLLSEDGDAKSSKSSNSVNTDINNKKSRFCQYLSDKPSEKTQAILIELFGDDAGAKKLYDNDICLDQSQLDVLSKSWRCENPEKLSAYKDEYRSCYPVHESSEAILQIPSLDDLLESLLCKRHGSKTVKSWGKNRQLASQPLKSIEAVAYQGPLSARYGLISVDYMQQALGTLLNNLQSEKLNIDRRVQSVRDIFAMSTKTLDQVGRSGAFHHIIHRKAAASDTGLNNLKEVQAKVMYLPLSCDGVFGKGLEECLKKRKEQKEQLFDLVRDFWILKQTV